jgi:hypothetical protein
MSFFGTEGEQGQKGFLSIPIEIGRPQSRFNNYKITKSMRFEKGNNFGKGRPKGSQNKTTVQLKEYLHTVSEHLESELLSDIDVLSPSERVKLWIQIQEFFIPKLSRQQIESGDNDVNINIIHKEPDYSKLSTDELKTLERILAKT